MTTRQVGWHVQEKMKDLWWVGVHLLFKYNIKVNRLVLWNKNLNTFAIVIRIISVVRNVFHTKKRALVKALNSIKKCSDIYAVH